MSYKLVNTGRQPENFYFDSWQINGYEIVLEMTIGAGIRLNIRRPPAGAWLHYWFCFSEPDPNTGRPQVAEADLLRLLNVAIELIQCDQLHLAPATTLRPYTKDTKFCAFIEPYQKVYIKRLNIGNILMGYVDIVDAFSPKADNNE